MNYTCLDCGEVTEQGAISCSCVNERTVLDMKQVEKELLEWAFNLLKHLDIIPKDTKLVIKEKEQ